MPTKRVLAALLLIALGFRPAGAQPVLIDFEHFPGPDGQLGTPDDIPIVPNQGWSGPSPGLTTQFAALGILFTPDPPVPGQNVVVHLSFLPDQTNLLGSFVNPIRAVFPTPVSRIALEFAWNNGPMFPNLLEALRADGSTIASVSVISGPASLSSAEPIYGFRASWPSGPAPQQCVIDNLSYTIVPAPPGMGVLAAAGLLARWRRRR
jgi:hypothetical protein